MSKLWNRKFVQGVLEARRGEDADAVHRTDGRISSCPTVVPYKGIC